MTGVTTIVDKNVEILPRPCMHVQTYLDYVCNMSEHNFNMFENFNGVTSLLDHKRIVFRLN